MKIRLPMNPILMQASPSAIRLLPPRLGEHTRDVLEEHGFAAEVIETLLMAAQPKS